MSLYKLRLSQDSDIDIYETEEKLKLAKIEYFRQLIVYNAFHKQLKDTNVNDVQSYGARDQTLRTMEQNMVIYESLQYLQNESGNIMGLLENGVQAIDNTVVKDEIVPEIQKLISAKAERLLSYNSDKSINSNDGIKSMVDDIRMKVTLIEDLKKDKLELNLELQNLLQEYFIELTEAMDTLNKVVEEYPLDPQLKRADSRVAILSAKLQVISKDMEILNLVLQQKIYSPAQRKNLNLIKHKILNQESALDCQIYDMTSQLASYNILGDEFLSVAKEYEKLLSELDIFKWAEKI